MAGEAGGSDDALPEDLDITAVRGAYTFPDIRRRRIAGVLYLILAAACLLAWFAAGSDAVLVNGGILAAGIVLALVGAFHIVTAWPLAVRDEQALVAAAAEVGFPVGHASAQLGWRGLLSKPTWRVLLYSSEEEPENRALVLVDAVDGRVLSYFVEDNPEDWS
ncbi:MAG: hypothetical protein ACRD12_11250 [Acidimicrobiales bacterium]